MLLPGDEIADADIVAKAVLRALDAPMTLEGHLVDVSASIGIAVHPSHGDERSTLLRHADVAMYAAKRNNSTYGGVGRSLRRAQPRAAIAHERFAPSGRVRPADAHVSTEGRASRGERDSVEALDTLEAPDPRD